MLMLIGEVFVLDDGGEVDLDLGNYERFLDVTLTRDNNITTGKIYNSVIQKEVLIDMRTLIGLIPIIIEKGRLPRKNCSSCSPCNR